MYTPQHERDGVKVPTIKLEVQRPCTYNANKVSSEHSEQCPPRKQSMPVKARLYIFNSQLIAFETLCNK